MMVVRAAAIPAFPKCGCASGDPFTDTGERSLRDHLFANASESRCAERMHNEFIAENTEIQMSVFFFDLFQQTVEQALLFRFVIVKSEIEHNSRCGLTIAFYAEVFTFKKSFAENRADFCGKRTVICFIIGFSEHFRKLCNRIRCIIEEACVGNLDGVYDKTGIQIMNFNTLFQIFAAVKEGYTPVMEAKRLLFIPDALSYMLTGKEICEYTIASTSQILNPRTAQLDSALLEAAGVDADIFPEITLPGCVIGQLTDALATETGIGKVDVVAVAGHDTASAVAAVPAENEKFAYLSSGTWSLMGIETKEPIINEESYRHNFTNEGGVDGTTRFLKNICGMWILEQCRKEWSRVGKEYSYPEIVAMTNEAEPFICFINPDDASFANPPSMLKAIEEFCVRTGQTVPQNDAHIIRTIFESLALRYREVLDILEGISPFAIDVLHIIGGGSKNRLLNQFTANAIGKRVVAGPSEATAIGNVMMQAIGAGAVGSLAEARQIIRASIETEEFLPQDRELWESAYKRFQTLK